jgi:hypothetical protein
LLILTGGAGILLRQELIRARCIKNVFEATSARLRGTTSFRPEWFLVQITETSDTVEGSLQCNGVERRVVFNRLERMQWNQN